MRNTLNLQENKPSPGLTSPELNRKRQFQYVKPIPTPNDMNSMCSFSPRETITNHVEGYRRITTTGYDSEQKIGFEPMNDNTMRYSENATFSTFRTRNAASNRKKLSLKHRKNVGLKSKELNSIDEHTRVRNQSYSRQNPIADISPQEGTFGKG
jgi:hypothetical protein